MPTYITLELILNNLNYWHYYRLTILKIDIKVIFIKWFDCVDNYIVHLDSCYYSLLMY